MTPFGFLSKTRALVAKSDSCNQLATNTAIHLIRADGGIEWSVCVCVCVGVSDGEDAFGECLLSSPTLLCSAVSSPPASVHQ